MGIKTTSELCGPAGPLFAHAQLVERAGLFPGGAWGCRPESCPGCHQHGDFVPGPVLSARMSQPEAEEAALGAHAVGYDGVRSGGGVLFPHHRR